MEAIKLVASLQYDLAWKNVTSLAQFMGHYVSSRAMKVKYQENATTGPKKYSKLSLNVIKVSWGIPNVLVFGGESAGLEAIVITLALVRRLNDICHAANGPPP